MKKAKNLSNKLMAALLSMAMIITTVLPGTTVYAAEPAIEAETAGSEDITSENEVPDEAGTENGITDETGSEDDGTDENGSGNEGSDESGSGSEGSDETGSGNEGSDETGSGSESSDGTDSENGDEDENVSGSEDTEGSDENVDNEETGEDVDEEAEVDELLAEDALEAEDVAPANVTKFIAGGWIESIYAEITGAKDGNITAVAWSGTASGELEGDDLEYLVRDAGNNKVRIDIPGLAAGAYTLTVSIDNDKSKEQKAENIKVTAYDRAGYAHFDSAKSNHGTGVGAYKDDGTLKPNAKVIYVTDENKNTVTISTKDGKTTVSGIGNILNSVGQDTGNGTTDKGSNITNKNQGIIKKLAEEGTPLVVRFIGTVSESGLYQMGKYDAADAGAIEGLTDYDSLGNGGSDNDNGHMARMKSGKDITLEGIGYDATIDGWGFHFMAETSSAEKGYGQSFEVRNLTFINTPEDAVGMEGVQKAENVESDLSAPVERCWIHHNEFYSPNIGSPAESDKSEGDGSVDFKRGQWFTCSYNYFEGCHKTNLVGSSKTSLQYNLSYHHNYWFLCKARGPLARNANIHMYNNIFDMQTDYAQNPRAGAYIFSEYNMFYMAKNPQQVEPGKETSKNWQINAIKSYNDNLASPQMSNYPATVVKNKDDEVANGCQFYARGIDYSDFDTDGNDSYIPASSVDRVGYENYTNSLETDFTELRKVIASQTGVMDETPVLPENVSPSYYSVVDRNINQNKSSITAIDLAAGYEKTNFAKSKVPFAFYVNGPADLEVSYSGSVTGTLVNEAGENLLEGDGVIQALPEGKYMIQPSDIQAGSYSGGKATLSTFKELTISSLKITALDPNAHYHKWVLNEGLSKPATCTAAGTNYYECQSANGECDQNGHKEEVTAPLGHSFNAWHNITEPDENNKVVQQRECSRCDAVETRTVDAGTTDNDNGSGGGTGGGSTGGATVEGDYVLYFENGQEVDPSNYFTVAGSIQKKQDNITIGDKTYTDSLKMDNSGKVTFSCNDGASLTMIFKSDNSGKVIDVTGATTGTKITKTIAKDSNGRLSIVVDELPADTYTISKNNGESKLFYVAVTNPASNVVYVTLSLEYNYDDAPDAKEVEVPEGTIFETAQNLASYAGFSRRNYTLKGFYTDADCTKAASFPYTADSDATFYADWKENAEEEISYYITFNTGGGTAVPQIRVSTKEIHVLTETTTKSGYAFAGWYDANPNVDNSNAKRIDKIIGSELTGPKTVYAKWNPLGEANSELTMVVAEDLKFLGTAISGSNGVNITQNTPVKGFTIRAQEGSNTNGKLFMTAKNNQLYTNEAHKPEIVTEVSDRIKKSIEFTTTASGVLAVEAKATDDFTQCDLILAKQSGTSYEEISAEVMSKSIETREFEIEEAGTYYLYVVGNKGVAYTSIKFLEPVYTIIYQTGMGTAKEALPDAETKKPGEVITLPKCDPLPGYIFKGWSADGGKTQIKDNQYTVSADDESNGTITLTALYDADTNYKPGEDENSGLVIVGLEESYIYTGAKITPNIGVVDYNIGEDGKLLSPGVDYTVKYSNNVKVTEGNKAGKAKVTVTGKGNYTGKDIDETFEIVNAETYEGELEDLKGAKIDKIAPQDYDGEEKYPDFNLTLKGKSAVTYKYDNGNYYKVEDGEITGEPLPVNWALSNNINKGTATLLLTGKIGTNKKATTVKKTFKINAIDLSKVNVVVDNIDSVPYSVKGAVVPAEKIVVRVDGFDEPLKNGIDYTVKFTSNKKATDGAKTANVVITGKGNFAKKPANKITYAIDKLDMGELKVSAVTAYEGMKAGKVKATVLDANDNILKASQYTVEVYKVNANDEKVKCEASEVLKSGEGNEIYVAARARDTKNLVSDSVTPDAEFTVGLNIAKAKFVINKDPVTKKAAKTYTGSEIKLKNTDLTVTMKGVSGNLTMGEDGDFVIVDYSNNINKGTATAVIKGVGRYSGTKTVKFKIVAKTMNISGRENTWNSVLSKVKSLANGIFE